MTFKILTGLILTMAQLAVVAQTVEPTSQALDMGAERERIGRERAASEVVYAASERACYSRFAVFDCLSDARRAKRLTTDELRRQELVLNDMERQAKAVDALKRIETNVAAQQEQIEKTAKPETQP
jgi:colicin import membrane protein